MVVALRAVVSLRHLICAIQRLLFRLWTRTRYLDEAERRGNLHYVTIRTTYSGFNQRRWWGYDSVSAITYHQRIFSPTTSRLDRPKSKHNDGRRRPTHVFKTFANRYQHWGFYSVLNQRVGSLMPSSHTCLLAHLWTAGVTGGT